MNSKTNNIFSILDNDVICQHKLETLPQFPDITFHNHDGYEIFLFLEGDTDYYVEGSGKHLEKGDLILTAPYVFHSSDSRYTRTYERIVINIKDSYMKTLCSHVTDLSLCFSKASHNRMNLIKLSEEEIKLFTLLTTELESNLSATSFGSELMIPALLTQILVMLNKKTLADDSHIIFTSVMPKIVKDTISYINEHITEAVSLSDLSRNIHHNADYISRCFKSVTGVSVQQFIIEKRCSLAKKYLSEGISPCDACFLSGFNNYSNFSRTFSKYTGMSPKQYQRLNAF